MYSNIHLVLLNLVFIDVRDRIPVPGVKKPLWLRQGIGSLDDLIRERSGELLQQSAATDGKKASSATAAAAADTTTANDGDPITNTAAPKVDTGTIESSSCILTSQELAASTNAHDSINFPLGHTVMVANSKSETYIQS